MYEWVSCHEYYNHATFYICNNYSVKKNSNVVVVDRFLLLLIAIIRSRADSQRSHVILHE